MTWARLEDKFHSNPKVVEAGNAATGLFACALSYCGDHLTDGHVPKGWAVKSGTAKERRVLVDVRLWLQVKKGDVAEVVVRRQGQEAFTVTVVMPSDGFFIRDFLDFNPSRGEVEAKREQNARKQREHRERQQTDESGRYAEVSNSVSHSAPDPSPFPSPEESQEPGANFKNPDPLSRLVEVMDDATELTRKNLAKLCARHHFAEGDFEAAREAALGPGVKSRSAVAISTLRERAA